MNVTMLALVGPHGAGKSTLGGALAARLGWRFDLEIGETHRRRVLAGDPGAHAFVPQPAFDEAVVQAELERDAVWWAEGCPPRVVETWHPGNLAYAAARSPAVANRWGAALKHAAGRAEGVLVVPLDLSLQAARRRRTEPGPPDAEQRFVAVGRQARELAACWGLPVAQVIWTEGCGVVETVERVVRLLVADERRPSRPLDV